MFKIFALAILVQLYVQCLSQSATEDGEDRPLLIYKGTPTRFILPKPVEIPERREVLYKTLRRSGRVPGYQYENGQEDDYHPQYQQTENEYSYQPAVTPQKEYENLLKKPLDETQRFRLIGKNKPNVEQYLKEVTPTTKTTAYQRPIQYLRFNVPQQSYAKSVQNDENQRAAQLQHVLPEGQQKSAYQQLYQYETADQSKTAPQTQYPPYQTALLTHQQQQHKEQVQSDIPSRSSIYVSQNIPKKTIRTKVGKPTQFQTLQPNSAYYNQLQQQRPQVFQQEPAAPRFQVRPTYQKEELNYQPTNPEAYAAEDNKEIQYNIQSNQRLNKYVVYGKTKPLTRKPVKYQEPSAEQAVEYETLDKQAARQQSLEEQNYYQQLERQKYANDEVPLQYQQELASKYQLQEQKGFRYEPTALNNDKYTSGQTTEDTLAKYQAALQKLQQESDSRLHAARTRQHPRFRVAGPQVSDELDQEGLVRYQSSRPQQIRQQYQEETQQYAQYEPLETQYTQPTEEKNVRYRPDVYRQNPASVRYYRNLRGI